ncbi:MAG: electron transport complex subunit E [Eubacterium sp.]|nr:electron transport complex subunit E [Eubacterium sp.]
MNKCAERLYNGVIKENPTFVQMLGMCPTLAVTSTAINGLGMGLATTAVLTMSNLMISALRKVIPDKVRIPAFITIIASFVTIISFLMQAYTPDLYDSLGVFISLIVVNCIILGRAEAYASKNPVIPSIFDGLGMGLGFTVGLTLIGIIREFLGAGKIFGFEVTTKLWDPIAIFTSNPGAFFVLAFLIAGINAFAIRKAKKTGGKPKLRRIDTCAGCTNLTCAGRRLADCPEGEDEADAEETTPKKKEFFDIENDVDVKAAIDKPGAAEVKNAEPIEGTMTLDMTTGKVTYTSPEEEEGKE